jgi:hypothetical protein
VSGPRLATNLPATQARQQRRSNAEFRHRRHHPDTSCVISWSESVRGALRICRHARRNEGVRTIGRPSELGVGPIPTASAGTRPNWLRSRRTSSSPIPVRSWRRCNRRPKPCRSYSRGLSTRSAPASSRAWHGRAVRDADQIEHSIVAFAAERSGGLIVLPSTVAAAHRETIIRLAARHWLPAVYPYRLFPAEGGLVSYGPHLLDLYRRAASYVDRVLKGEKPADLPVQASRAGDKSQDREGARPDRTRQAARAGRRGDRVRPRFPARPSI